MIYQNNSQAFVSALTGEWRVSKPKLVLVQFLNVFHANLEDRIRLITSWLSFKGIDTNMLDCDNYVSALRKILEGPNSGFVSSHYVYSKDGTLATKAESLAIDLGILFAAQAVEQGLKWEVIRSKFGKGKLLHFGAKHKSEKYTAVEVNVAFRQLATLNDYSSDLDWLFITRTHAIILRH